MKISITAAVAAAAGAPLVAHAQDRDRDQTRVEVRQERQELRGAFAPALYPNTFTLGAGALGPVNSGFNPGNPDGVSWNLRYGWHPVNLLTWEIGYTGATNEVSSQNAPNTTVATLLETGVKLDVIPRSAFSPILAAGVGYGAFTAGQQQDLATMTVPLAVGLEGRAENLLLGTRFTYRPTFFDQLAFSDMGADSWIWTADIGTRF